MAAEEEAALHLLCGLNVEVIALHDVSRPIDRISFFSMFFRCFFDVLMFFTYFRPDQRSRTASKLQRRWEMRRALEQASDEPAGR